MDKIEKTIKELNEVNGKVFTTTLVQKVVNNKDQYRLLEDELEKQLLYSKI